MPPRPQRQPLLYKRLVPPPGPLELVIDPEDPQRTARIENVVVSYRIVRACDGRGVIFDLPKTAARTRTLYPGFYDARSVRALKFRFCLQHPATQPAALLFSTGQVNQAGEQVPENARHTAHTLARILSEVVGVRLAVSNFKITNMVAHTRLPSAIELAFLVSAVGNDRVQFDVQMAMELGSLHAPLRRPFSAARVTPLTLPKMKFSFFRSGAVVMPGAKDTQQFITAMREIFEIYDRVQDVAHNDDKRLQAWSTAEDMVNDVQITAQHRWANAQQFGDSARK